MAVITATSGVLGSSSNGPTNLSRTTLTASDTFTYVQGSGQTLALFNTTASAVAITIGGSLPTSLTPAGFGGIVSTAGGKSVTVPASGATYLELDDIWAFLTGNGTITVTNGTGLSAVLFN